jgi:hypothetical protein
MTENTLPRSRAIISSRGHIPKLREGIGGWRHGDLEPIRCKVAATARRAQDLIDYAAAKMGVAAPRYAGGDWASQLPYVDAIKKKIQRDNMEDGPDGSTKLLLDIGGLKSNLKTLAENSGCSATKLATMILESGIQKMNAGGSFVTPASLIDADCSPEPPSEMLHAIVTARRTCSRCRETYKIRVEMSDMRPSLSRSIFKDLPDLIADEMEDVGWKSGVCPSCSVNHGEEISLQDLAEYRADQEN